MTLPQIENSRDTILSERDWALLVTPLWQYDNAYLLPLVRMTLETAMRSCEPLTQMTWQDIDWDRRVLHLPDSKTGRRDVPLALARWSPKKRRLRRKHLKRRTAQHHRATERKLSHPT